MLGLLAVLSAATAQAEECAASYTLPQAEQQALTGNPDLRIAREAATGALADLTSAGERPNPQLTVSSTAYPLTHAHSFASTYARQADTIFRLDQLVERGHKRALRLAAANSGSAAAEAEAADQRRETVLAARVALYDLGLQERKLAIERELAELAHNSLNAANRRQKAGDLSRIDLARLQIESAKADNDVREAEADAGDARTRLGYVLGCAANATLTTAIDWPTPVPVSLSSGMAALEGRADVVAAKARADQAAQRLALAKSQATRDVSVGVQYEHSIPQGGNALGGVYVSVPLFLAHRYEGGIARAASDADAAKAVKTKVEATATAELAAAENDLASNTEKLRRYRDQILPQAQTAADAIEYANSKGAVSLLDLIDARRTLRGALLETANAEASYAKALAGWMAATEAYQAPQKAASSNTSP